jgi:hypothetical protein
LCDRADESLFAVALWYLARKSNDVSSPFLVVELVALGEPDFARVSLVVSKRVFNSHAMLKRPSGVIASFQL